MHRESTNDTDEAIVLRVQNGDTEAFGVLVDRYSEKIGRYGRKFLSTKEDIQDLMQDIFIKAYENIKSFNTSLKFSPWIYRIAHNVYVDHIRKGVRNPFIYVDFDTFLAHPIYEDNEHSASERNQLKEEIDQALDTLDTKYREVLILYFLEDMSYKEIANILSVPVSTVAIRIKRAKEALKKNLEK